jgi:hypothetical protein
VATHFRPLLSVLWFDQGKGSLLHLLIGTFVESFVDDTYGRRIHDDQRIISANAHAMIGTLIPQLCRLIRASYDPTLKQPDGKDALALLVSRAKPNGTDGWVYCLAEALLDRGANVNTRFNDQTTPLIDWASSSEGNDSATPYLMLLNRDADIDAQDGRGKTVLHWLAQRAHIEALKELADAGWLTAANLTLLNNAGETALETARRELNADDSVDVVQRRVICDLLREQATLWTEEARPLIHLLLSHSLRIPDLAHMVLSFVDGKERGQ